MVELWTKRAWERAEGLRPVARLAVVASVWSDIDALIKRSDQLNNDHVL